MYKERLDQGWKKMTVDWVDGTMGFAITLWEAREFHKAHIVFGQWLEKQGYGVSVLNTQNRSALINMGAPEIREISRRILINTKLRCWENIWSEEVKPEAINRGLYALPAPRVLRQPRKARQNSIAQPIQPPTNLSTPEQPIAPTIAQPPAEHKPPPAPTTEREMLQQLNEKEGYKAWMVIEDPPVIGRMPDDAKEQFYNRIREINQLCHELFQLSLYENQMDSIAKKRLAVEFKGIKKWGEILFERMLGHKRFSQAEILMCDIEAPFRKLEN